MLCIIFIGTTQCARKWKARGELLTMRLDDLFVILIYLLILFGGSAYLIFLQECLFLLINYLCNLSDANFMLASNNRVGCAC